MKTFKKILLIFGVIAILSMLLNGFGAFDKLKDKEESKEKEEIPVETVSFRLHSAAGNFVITCPSGMTWNEFIEISTDNEKYNTAIFNGDFSISCLDPYTNDLSVSDYFSSEMILLTDGVVSFCGSEIVYSKDFTNVIKGTDLIDNCHYGTALEVSFMSADNVLLEKINLFKNIDYYSASELYPDLIQVKEGIFYFKNVEDRSFASMNEPVIVRNSYTLTVLSSSFN